MSGSGYPKGGLQRPGKPAVPLRVSVDVALQEAVAQWAIDDPKRYQSVSGRRLGTHGVGQPGHAVEAREDVVVTVALEVPVAHIEQVTAWLREGGRLSKPEEFDRRSERNYLSTCASYAFEARALEDELITLRAQNKALRGVVHQVVEQANERNPKGRHAMQALAGELLSRVQGEDFPLSLQAVGRMRDALLEKNAGVAAKLLRDLPDDGDW